MRDAGKSKWILDSSFNNVGDGTLDVGDGVLGIGGGDLGIGDGESDFGDGNSDAGDGNSDDTELVGLLISALVFRLASPATITETG